MEDLEKLLIDIHELTGGYTRRQPYMDNTLDRVKDLIEQFEATKQGKE